MSTVRPIRERTLLIDNETLLDFHRTVNPAIDTALKSRGFVEERVPAGRIHLDGIHLHPSPLFRELYQAPFDGLQMASVHEVFENESQLVKSALRLSRVGGFTASRLAVIGDRYYSKNLYPDTPKKEAPAARISQEGMHDILQDIRAHTTLGYSSSDEAVPIPTLIQELEGLYDTISVDQRARYQLLTPPEHGNIQMNIGRSFEVKTVHTGDRLRKRRSAIKRLFEIIAHQPIEDGTVIVGMHYQSGRKRPEVKVTAEIVSDAYSDQDKQALYNGLIRSHQEDKPSAIGRGILKNLSTIADTDSDIIRVG